jgi:hypothetical protein
MMALDRKAVTLMVSTFACKQEAPGTSLFVARIALRRCGQGEERRALLAEHAAQTRQDLSKGFIAVPAYQPGNLDGRTALLAAATVHLESIISPDGKLVEMGKPSRGHDGYVVVGAPSS